MYIAKNQLIIIVCNLKDQCAVGMFITCNQKQNWFYHHKCTTDICFSPHYCKKFWIRSWFKSC